jgi:hypothetical protein
VSKFRRKVVEVYARKWEGPGTLNVVHDVKGQQTAKKGDWLVGHEKGLIEVVKDVDFQRDCEVSATNFAAEVKALGDLVSDPPEQWKPVPPSRQYPGKKTKE